MDACARVGDVEVAKGTTERQEGAVYEVPGTGTSRSNVGRSFGSRRGLSSGVLERAM